MGSFIRMTQLNGNQRLSIIFNKRSKKKKINFDERNFVFRFVFWNIFRIKLVDLNVHLSRKNKTTTIRRKRRRREKIEPIYKHAEYCVC